jgi:hypothetical protein
MRAPCPLEEGGSAIGVLITDRSLGPGGDGDKRAPLFNQAPEQKLAVYEGTKLSHRDSQLADFEFRKSPGLNKFSLG